MAISLNSFAQLPVVSSGSLQRHENLASRFVLSRNIDVWLPDGYTTGKKYAVLYMHDGQMLFDSAINWNGQDWGVDETMGRLLKENKIMDCIVVGIWNTTRRHMEYFPQKALEYLDQPQIDELMKAGRGEGTNPLFEEGIQSDLYLKFLVEELKPLIDFTYSTYTDREHTFISGSSMGGLISMYAMCENPDIFGGAACLSTHWPGTFTVENNPVPGAFLAYLRDHLPKPVDHLFYFDFGTETLDAMYEPFQRQADEIMNRGGYSDENRMTKKFPGENHSENAWKKRFEIPLLFLMGL